MLGRNDDKASPFPLDDSTDTKVAHVHIAVISEIITLLVVILAALLDFVGVEPTLGCCFLATLSQIDDMVYDIVDVIAGIGGMTP